MTSFVFQAQVGTGAIRHHDPGFDDTSFLSWTEDVHAAVVTALNNQDAGALRQYVADSLYRRLAAQIGQAKEQGHTPAKVDPACERPTIVRADTNDSFDTLVVRLYPPSHGETLHAGAVDWTFQRSSQLKTMPGPLKASASDTCTSCGAPLQLDGNSCCVYCHTPAAGPKFDWLLTDMEPAAPDISEVVAAAAKSGRRWVGITVAAVVFFAVGLPIILAATHSSSSPRITIPTFTIPSFTIPTISIPDIVVPTVPNTKSINVELSLSGGIRLSPSQLDSGDLSLNGGHFGDCPSTPVTSIGLNTTFDSGDQLQGTFTLPAPAKVGVPTDFSPGGSAMLSETPNTGSAQTWTLPAGKTGAVTVTVNAAGGGTLTWTALPPGVHNGTSALSGSATWTCS